MPHSDIPAGVGRGRSGSGSAIARRRAARLAAVQALYQIDLAGARVETVLSEFLNLRLGWEVDGDRFVPADPQLFAAIVRGAATRQTDVDAMLDQALAERSRLSRIEPLLRSILRAGAFELLAHHDIEPRILLNEYIDVTHAFYAGREPAVVNGVLDRLAHVLRPDDVNTVRPDPADGFA